MRRGGEEEETVSRWGEFLKLDDFLTWIGEGSRQGSALMGKMKSGRPGLLQLRVREWGQPTVVHGAVARGATTVIQATGGWKWRQVGWLGQDGTEDWAKARKTAGEILSNF
jgi:hypothetical protein